MTCIRFRSLVELALFALFATGCGAEHRCAARTQTDGRTARTASANGSVVSSIRFHERPLPEGAAFVHRNGEESGQASILEIVGGGVAIFDYDADGQLDLFFPGGGRFGAGRELVPLPGALLRNAGDWRFARHEGEAGLNSPRRYNHGTAVGDHDNDGFPDLLITGYGGLQLYLNAGDGTYRDRTREARLDDPLWSTSAAWGDFNGDGNLDLFVVHYVDWSFDNDPFCPAFDGRRRERCTPQRYGPLPESLYLSRGDGTFADASQNSGLRRDGKGLGVVLADVDLDGDLDIYVANDTVQNFLYCNDAHAHFEELGSAWGAAFNDRGAPDGSMGVAVTDYNLDGLPDLWVANYEGETIALYKNLGAAGFEHVSQRTGVAAVSDLAVGFGTLFFDADRDGDDDAVVVNGHVLLFPKNAPRRQLPLLFENLAGKKLVNVAPQAGDYFCANHMGRGLARGDLDGDGDIDLAVAHLNEPIALLENTTADPDAWLAVRLIGTTSNRDAVGARVTLHTSPAEKSSNVQSRQVTSGDSYLSHSDRMLFWGVPRDISRDISGDISGGQTAASLVIHWPSGRTQTISNLSLNRRLTIVEPD